MSILDKVFSQKTITYIANAGVMISLKNMKIIIDGILDELPEGYIRPEESFSESLILSREPYHNIDYIFTTHSHKDHITPDILNELLKRNRHVKHIGPKAVTKFISSRANYNDILSSQLFTVSLKTHGKMDVSFSDLSFSAYRLPHDGVHHSTMENIAYKIDASSTTIIALGDSAPRVGDFEKAGLTDKCDILICHANMVGQKSGRQIIKMLSPKNLILTHITNDDAAKERIISLCEKYKKDLPKTSVLTTAGQSVKL